MPPLLTVLKGFFHSVLSLGAPNPTRLQPTTPACFSFRKCALILSLHSTSKYAVRPQVLPAISGFCLLLTKSLNGYSSPSFHLLHHPFHFLRPLSPAFISLPSCFPLAVLGLSPLQLSNHLLPGPFLHLASNIPKNSSRERVQWSGS